MSLSPSFLAPALSTAGVICLVAVLPMPYGWYMLTRWVVCAVSIAATLHWYGRSDKIAVAAMVIALLFKRFGRDSGNFRKIGNKPLRLQGKFDVFGHGALIPIQVQGVMA